MEELADVASACLTWGKGHPIADAARDDADFVLPDEELAEFGLDVEDAGLRDNEAVAIEGGKRRVGFHVSSDAEEPDGEAGLCGWISVASEEAL